MFFTFKFGFIKLTIWTFNSTSVGSAAEPVAANVSSDLADPSSGPAPAVEAPSLAPPQAASTPVKHPAASTPPPNTDVTEKENNEEEEEEEEDEWEDVVGGDDDDDYNDEDDDEGNDESFDRFVRAHTLRLDVHSGVAVGCADSTQGLSAI